MYFGHKSFLGRGWNHGGGGGGAGGAGDLRKGEARHDSDELAHSRGLHAVKLLKS